MYNIIIYSIYNVFNILKQQSMDSSHEKGKIQYYEAFLSSKSSL